MEMYMETYQLTIKQTQVTPYVSFNFNVGLLSMSGDLYPENPHDLFDYIEGYISKIDTKFNIPGMLVINIYILNSASHKRLLGLMQKLETLYSDFSVKWICEHDDTDAIDTGNIYKDILDSNVDVVILRDRGVSTKN